MEKIIQFLKKNNNKNIFIFNGDSIGYNFSCGIKFEREVKIENDEEFVRAIWLNYLVSDLKYKKENIIVEYSIRARAGRKERDKRVDIVLQKDNQPWALIELKTDTQYNEELLKSIEGQLFGLSLFEDDSDKINNLVYGTISEKEKGIFIPEMQIINYKKYKKYEDWKKSGFAYSDKFVARYGTPERKIYKNNEKFGLAKEISTQNIDSLGKEMHNVLWGGGGTTDSDVFNFITRLILAKIYDEESTNKNEKYKFQIYQINDGEDEDDKGLLDRINDLYRGGLVNKLNYSEADSKNSDIYIENKISLNKLRYAITRFQGISLLEISKNSKNSKNNNSDILGKFFENIMRTGFKQSKGQFFTHQTIIRFMVYGLELDNLALDRMLKNADLPKIIDPSAGSGAFLVEAMKTITKHITSKKDKFQKNISLRNKYKDLFGRSRKNSWAEDYCFGLEYNAELGLAAKVNMILHSDGASSIFVGEEYGDGLKEFTKYSQASPLKHAKNSNDVSYTKKVNEKFDIIITNPPFSLKLIEEQKKIYKDIFQLQIKSSECLFIERFYQLLKPGGRIAVVLPNSIFDGEQTKYIREFLIDKFDIKAIISLPAETFAPYTQTKTSILFAQKKSNESVNDEILFAEINKIGYSRTSRQETSRKNDLFNVDDDGNVITNDEKTVLGVMRKKINWGI